MPHGLLRSLPEHLYPTDEAIGGNREHIGLLEVQILVGIPEVLGHPRKSGTAVGGVGNEVDVVAVIRGHRLGEELDVLVTTGEPIAERPDPFYVQCEDILERRPVLRAQVFEEPLDDVAHTYDDLTQPGATANTRPGLEPATQTPPATGRRTLGPVPMLRFRDSGAGDTFRSDCAVPSPT